MVERSGKILATLTAAAILALGLWTAYYYLWARHAYIVTAYCNCPICINVKDFQDGKFANNKPVHWGAVAADKSIPFGSRVELVPFLPTDWFSINRFLGGQKEFVVEDRGGKIKGRHIDIFFPDSMGGHQTAKKWGVRRMRVKINGRLAE
ncbi:MAG TPA: 3D domain-containing protein [Candidatus Omnitrophota bacterium]|nr:3D domain-containing protein [Candidatus Omnitrophota bacterium]HRY86027.1 3D domain-containing protein [Candidatus Omnitrophota bacterium]